MARPKNVELVEETQLAIKKTARKLMAEKGAAGLSLRGIARALGITAPALYHYYANLDELITALIVDSFNALADAVEAGRDISKDAGGSLIDQLMGATWAYRQWALDHSIDFQLIYGSPIPGYEAPKELTVPASARTLQIIGSIIQDMVNEGIFQPSPFYQEIPETIREPIQQIIDQSQVTATPTLIYLTMYGWAKIHGVVMLELFDHIPPIIGDMDTFYRDYLKNILRGWGIAIE